MEEQELPSNESGHVSTVSTAQLTLTAASEQAEPSNDAEVSQDG